MSTLRVNNITDTSGGSSSLSVPGAAKAWVAFNGAGVVAIRAQLNVSSITDNGVGDYSINFATAMPDANYACVGLSGGAGSYGSTMSEQMTGAGRTASLIRIGTASNNGAGLTDDSYNNVAIFR